MEGEAVYCDICKMWLNGPTQWEDHRIGRKHKKNCIRQENPHPECPEPCPEPSLSSSKPKSQTKKKAAGSPKPKSQTKKKAAGSQPSRADMRGDQDAQYPSYQHHDPGYPYAHPAMPPPPPGLPPLSPPPLPPPLYAPPPPGLPPSPQPFGGYAVDQHPQPYSFGGMPSPAQMMGPAEYWSWSMPQGAMMPYTNAGTPYT